MKNPSNSAAFSHPALSDLPALRAAVCEAVKQAGAMLEAEFSRARGPRGSYSKAPVDVEIEEFLHHALTALLPVPFRAEEKHDITPDAGGTLWLVDPHDGTSAFLGGFRGSAVSVALLHQCVPVLGVVYAPSSPDRGPDLISWAEGLPTVLRNGVPVAGQPGNPGTLLLAHHYAPTKLAEWHGRAAPGQFFAMPSIAYRLARVACGDATATCPLGGTQDWDYAAGHALLRGAGGVLVDARGEPVQYSPRGVSHTSELFGGVPEAVEQ
jgi:fructose-1,6-bisphosphatase/inositol monophosphatase family enzyme